MADELPDGLVVADETGRLVVFNRAAVRLTSVAAADAIGKYVFDVLPFRDEDSRDWWVCVDPYHGLSTRARHPERSLYLADGTELLVSVGYVRDGRSGPVRRLVITLRGAQQRARLERSRAELVSTVAHELRSPLTSVKGFTATLLAKWGRFTDDQKRVMLETVNADADRVTRLITELLDVSRIESGRMEVHRQLVDVPDRARKIIAGRVAAGEPEDRFRLAAAPDLPETWLDADKIDQILGNLVENAVRHGAGIVTVMVDSAHANAGGQPGAIVVSVRDQGEGIPPEMAPEGLPPVLAGQAPRRHRPRPLHRQGPGRGARRRHLRGPGPRRRRRVPIYRARGRAHRLSGRNAAATGRRAAAGFPPAPGACVPTGVTTVFAASR